MRGYISSAKSSLQLAYLMLFRSAIIFIGLKRDDYFDYSRSLTIRTITITVAIMMGIMKIMIVIRITVCLMMRIRIMRMMLIIKSDNININGDYKLLIMAMILTTIIARSTFVLLILMIAVEMIISAMVKKNILIY